MTNHTTVSNPKSNSHPDSVSSGSIKRIRWDNINDGRWYGISTAIKIQHKSSTWALVYYPVDSKNRCGLTEAGRQLVNELIAVDGISSVSVGSYGINVKIDRVFFMDDFHALIMEKIREHIFAGEQVIVIEPLTAAPAQSCSG